MARRPPPRLNGNGTTRRRTSAQKAADGAATARARELYVQRTYGISPAMYRALETYQGGTCWGCRRARGVSKELAVDHNHATGEVRMLLCSTCNQLVGHFRDDPLALIRLGLALISPPSREAWAQLGVPGWTTDDDELIDYVKGVE